MKYTRKLTVGPANSSEVVLESISMRRFESAWDYEKFARSIRQSSRYVFEGSVEEFLATVLETGKKRRWALASRSTLWRAQLGHAWKVWETAPGAKGKMPDAYPEERMKPTPDSAGNGRINPRGIPCLYLADDANTAMAEMRPWFGSVLSLARFETIRELTLIDCSEFDGWLDMAVPDNWMSAEAKERTVWQRIAYAFSEPAERSDSIIEYAPTQVLAEAFRKDGYDGIRYKSLVGDGRNIALFNLNDAQMVGEGDLRRTQRVSYEFG